MRTYRVPVPEIRLENFGASLRFCGGQRISAARHVAPRWMAAALESIKRQGGGIVEAYPVANWEGKSFGNMSTHGTVSMFKKAGFKRVAPFGNTNVVMRGKI